MTQPSAARDRYHTAISNLFDVLSRTPQFGSDVELREAAIQAQTTLGKVEERSEVLGPAKNESERRAFSDELRKAEAELDAATANLLKKVFGVVDVDIARAGLELSDARAAVTLKLPDPAADKARRDHEILQKMKHKAPRIKPRKRR